MSQPEAYQPDSRIMPSTAMVDSTTSPLFIMLYAARWLLQYKVAGFHGHASAALGSCSPQTGISVPCLASILQ